MLFSCMGAHRGRWRLAVSYEGSCKMECLFNIELSGKTCYTMDRKKGVFTGMARIIGIGHQDFTELIASGCFYVDKKPIHIFFGQS